MTPFFMGFGIVHRNNAGSRGRTHAGHLARAEAAVDEMNAPDPRAGDTVVPLGTLLTTAATLCGAVDAGLVLWTFEGAWWNWSSPAFVDC